MHEYHTRAINNRSLNSGKTFWAFVCGYYSREVTIQEKLFCTAMSTTVINEIAILSRYKKENCCTGTELSKISFIFDKPVKRYGGSTEN